MHSSSSREQFSYEALHPKARESFRLLSARLEQGYRAGSTNTLFRPFEGFRSNERQDYLYTVEKTTKARAWRSAHNYGLAVDYVAYKDGVWSWEGPIDWLFLKQAAVGAGLLVPISWDKPHVEHPIWQQVKGSLL